ncbi:hypothetical protein B0H13DRAFT_1883112 [Mycena leptocephala]|nr:hypothetical protein B0H13DRAFT_1883112 [Mycena leptocephala]
MSALVQETRVSALENCRDFTIQGGTFNVSTTVEQPQGDFRVVKLGDLNLLDEIGKYDVVERRPVHHKRTGAVVRHIKVVVGTRRIYRARIFGSQDPMTAIVYNDAQFEQFFGFTSSAGLSALIYHDEMMTVSQVKQLHAKSALALHYFKYEISWQLQAANSHWHGTTGDSFYNLSGTAWIRLSTGKLCMDVGNGYESCLNFLTSGAHFELPEVNLTEYDLGDKLLSTLELDEFYSMVACNTTHYLNSSPSMSGTIMLPSIHNPHGDRTHSKSNDLHAIPTEKHLTLDDLHIFPWYTSDSPQEVLPTGWKRVDYSECHSCLFSIDVGFKDYTAPMKWWLSQQHYVRNHLQGAFNATELITGISFTCMLKTDMDLTLRGTFMADAPTDKVYLFLFSPQVEVMDGQLFVTNPPDIEKYYWAFDPAGLNRLTHDLAEDLGLPAVGFSTTIFGESWNECDYNMVRDFHIAKGFDPYSQDAAIAAGYPLIDIEKMKKFIPGFADESPMDSSDVEVEDEIYYSLGLC